MSYDTVKSVTLFTTSMPHGHENHATVLEILCIDVNM